MVSQISRRLKEEREAANLTQAEAAAILGVDPMTVSKRERGDRGISAEKFEQAIAAYRQHAKLSQSVPRGTLAMREPAAVYGSVRPKPAGIPAEVARKIELFKREMAKADASEAELDYIDETFRRPETARLAHHDSDGKALSPAQVEEQYDALIEGVRQIITRRIDRRRKAAKAK